MNAGAVAAPRTGRRRVVVRLLVVAVAAGVVHALRPGVVENGVRSPRLWLVVAGVLLAARLVAVVVTRATGRPRAAGLASDAVVVAAVVVLLAPSFGQRELDEPFPVLAAAAPVAGAVAPRELAAGALGGVGHSASGRTVLYDVGGEVVLRFEGVDVEGTPGPYVHLVPRGGRDPGGGVRLGALRAERGSFAYDVPAGLDLTAGWTVLVWCAPFATPVAAADLVAA